MFGYAMLSRNQQILDRIWTSNLGNCLKRVSEWRSGTSYLRETNRFYVEFEARKTKIHMQNMYCELMNFGRAHWKNRLKAVSKWCSGTPCIRETNRFWAEPEVRDTIFTCRTFILNEFWENALKKLAQSSSKYRSGKPCLQETNRFWAEPETRETKIRTQNIYFEGVLDERIEEIGANQS